VFVVAKVSNILVNQRNFSVPLLAGAMAARRRDKHRKVSPSSILEY
jgi:hypothetical protein